MNMHPYYQTLCVVWGNQILFWGTTLLFFEPTFVIMAIVAMYFFGCISEISIHRYFTHKAYKTTPLKEKLLVALATLVGQGAMLSWVSVHRTHHAFEDTIKDPHTPHFIPKWKLILGLFPRQEYKVQLISDLIRSNNKKYFVFENKYYWLIWLAIWVTTAVLLPYLFYFIVAGSALWYLCTSLVNIVAHNKVGNKKYEKAVAINSSWIHFVTGAGYHNNHHGNPKSHSYRTSGETDIYAWVIEKCFMIQDAK